MARLAPAAVTAPLYVRFFDGSWRRRLTAIPGGGILPRVSSNFLSFMLAPMLCLTIHAPVLDCISMERPAP
jgi:hypothetical protein